MIQSRNIAVTDVTQLNPLGVAAFKSKNYSEAVRCFDRFLATRPDPSVFYNCGRAYEELGQLTIAADRYISALSLTPGLEKAQVRLDWISQRVGAKVDWIAVDLMAPVGNSDRPYLILEFGEGLYAGFKGYNTQSSPPGEYQAVMTNRVKDAVEELGLPLLWEDGLDLLRYSFISPEKALAVPKSRAFKIDDLSTYACVLNKSWGFRPRVDQLVLSSNVALTMATRKSVLSQFSTEIPSDGIFPKSKVYPKVTTQSVKKIAAQIRADFSGHKAVVLKEPVVDGGQGIHIVKLKQKALEDTLLSHFFSVADAESLMNGSFESLLKSFQALRSGRNTDYPTFVVQEQVKTDGRVKDATIRASVLVIRDKGDVRVRLVDAFYRTADPDHIVRSGSDAVLMSDDERSRVQQFFESDRVKTYFRSLLALDVRDMLARAQGSDDSGNFSTSVASALSAGGMAVTARAVLLDSKSRHSKSDLAKVLYFEGDYAGAIRLLTEVIDAQPCGTSYYRRGKSYFRLGNLEAAMGDYFLAYQYHCMDNKFLRDFQDIQKLASGQHLVPL